MCGAFGSPWICGILSSCFCLLCLFYALFGEVEVTYQTCYQLSSLSHKLCFVVLRNKKTQKNQLFFFLLPPPIVYCGFGAERWLRWLTLTPSTVVSLLKNLTKQIKQSWKPEIKEHTPPSSPTFTDSNISHQNSTKLESELMVK